MNRKAIDWIKNSDGLLIAAANGLSISEGFDILRPSKWFADNFPEVLPSGIQTPIQLLQSQFFSPQTFNQLFTRLMTLIHYQKPVSEMMKQLHQISEIRPSFVITTNVEDRFPQAGFKPDQVFYLEGRLSADLQNQPIEEADLPQITSITQLEMWNYLQSAHFQNKMQDLSEFIQKHSRIVILQLGVSRQNPWIQPIIHHVMDQNRQARLILCDLAPAASVWPERTVNLPGPLDRTIEELRDKSLEAETGAFR